MCGITAISRAEGRSAIPDARAFMLAAALAIESRGPDAVGFGWADPNGHPWYWKDAGRASKVARWADLPVGMRTAIGHTRWATHGDPKVNENNHPVVAPGLVLVHNGVLRNHAELFRDLGVAPTAEVDSEALAALLAYGGSVHNASGPAELLGRVRGDAAIAWLDADSPQVLHLARLRGRPMTLGWTRRGDLVMSSTPETLALTAMLSKVTITRTEHVPEGQYLRVEQGRIMDRVRVELPKITVKVSFPSNWGTPLLKQEARPTAETAMARRTGQPRQIERPAGHEALTERINPWRVK